MQEKGKKSPPKRVQKTSPPDLFFLTVVIMLTVFGFMMLSSASSDIGARNFGDSYYYIKNQFLHFLLAGIPGFLVGFFMPYRWFKKIAAPFLGLVLVLLLLVFVPGLGVTVKGASRWVAVGGFTFQPGEVMKLAIIIFFSAWLSASRERAKSVSKGLIPFLFVLGVVMLVFLLQPSTTITLIVAAASLIVYFVNGLSLKHFGVVCLVGLLLFGVFISTTPYRFERVKTFVVQMAGQGDKEFARDENYQLQKTLRALQFGGLFGRGFGDAETKTTIPEVVGDAIFAVVGEEFGFLGSLFVIALFATFVWRGFYLARRVSDDFGKSLIIGFVSMIAIQSVVNIGATSGLIPFTGVPLPFMSYGGTALAVFLTMSGIIANISRYRR